ncbi:hypothetical protein E5B83_06205 [Campylobacter coli]|nr:hypothetical protein [Campylobacter coli]
MLKYINYTIILIKNCINRQIMQKYKYHWGKVPYKKILNRDSVFEIKNEEGFLFFKQVLDRKGK